MNQSAPPGDAAEPSITFEVLTLFPDAVTQFAAAGLLGKAIDRGLVRVVATDIRAFTQDKHRTADDAPFGGGAGMVMKPEPVVAALEAVESARGRTHRVLVTPSAPRFDQRVAERLARLPRIAVLCGRYEGIDDRVREHFVDECLSLGDFILGGGEVAALAIIEAVSRLREGVLGNPESIQTESFAAAEQGLRLEHPHYTRPANFRGHEVPAVLLGGDHAAIARWREHQALRRTLWLRPDLCPPSPPTPLAEHTDVHVVFDASAEPPDGVAEVLRDRGATAVVLIGKAQARLLLWAKALEGRVQVAMLGDVKQLYKRLRKQRGVSARILQVTSGDLADYAPTPADAAVARAELAAAGPPHAPIIVVMPGVSLPGPPDAVYALPRTGAADPSVVEGAKTQGQSLATEAAIADASRPFTLTVQHIDHALCGLRGRQSADR